MKPGNNFRVKMNMHMGCIIYGLSIKFLIAEFILYFKPHDTRAMFFIVQYGGIQIWQIFLCYIKQ